MSKEIVLKETESSLFAQVLLRNNSQIRKDRALAIVEDTHLIYKRTIEDIEMRIKKLKREREQMRDLSPTTATSLNPVKDFDAVQFVADDLELGFKIRNEEIRLEIAYRQFNELFGD